MKLRLASFNLLSGRSLDGAADPDRLAGALATLDADVLALQEVDRHQPRTGGVDQAALAATVLDAAAQRFVPLVRGTPGVKGWQPVLIGRSSDDGSAKINQADYGIALLSRRPVASWHVLALGSTPGRYPIYTPGGPTRVIWIPDEPRAAVAAVLESPALTVACTHLSFLPGRNAFQLRRIRAWLEGLPGPRVLLGDLNLPGRLPARLTGWTPLVSTPTFPSPAPRLQLDHVLAHQLPGSARARGQALELPVSDHRAVLVDLEL